MAPAHVLPRGRGASDCRLAVRVGRAHPPVLHIDGGRCRARGGTAAVSRRAGGADCAVCGSSPVPGRRRGRRIRTVCGTRHAMSTDNDAGSAGLSEIAGHVQVWRAVFLIRGDPVARSDCAARPGAQCPDCADAGRWGRPPVRGLCGGGSERLLRTRCVPPAGQSDRSKSGTRPAIPSASEAPMVAAAAHATGLTAVCQACSCGRCGL